MKNFKNKLDSLYNKEKIIQVKEICVSFISKKIKITSIQDKISKILNNKNKIDIPFNALNPGKWIENLQDMIESKVRENCSVQTDGKI